MRIIDVDAHFHEPVDWLQRVNPDIAEELGTPARFMDIAGRLFGSYPSAFAALPEQQQPRDVWDNVLPGFVHHLQMTGDREPQTHDDPEKAVFFEADARIRFCDERGIDTQFLNPSFLVNPIIQAARQHKGHLIRPIRGAWNTWASDQVHDHAKRLIPVTQIDLNDVAWSLGEMQRMRASGSRAFAIPESPVGGRASGTLARSITHPDFEPIWSAAEDLGMAAFAHVGFARERINPGWANNGADSVRTFAILRSIVASAAGTQLMLAAMIFDGVFERHPNLVVVVEEVGIDWLPPLVAALEASIGRRPAHIQDGEFRPSNLVIGESYTLPLTPLEYLQRQVRVTPLPTSQPIDTVIQQVPPELLCFSTDFPHVEGAADPIAIFERQLVGQPGAVREAFFGGVGALIGI
ncbi:MAG: amidohydrolase family protein [Gammaproteobacteria bacterium]|nr:amidohydrolase family protein [Gammaproteobacteria bacterium]